MRSPLSGAPPQRSAPSAPTSRIASRLDSSPPIMRRHDRSRRPRPQNKNPHEAGFVLFELSGSSIHIAVCFAFWVAVSASHQSHVLRPERRRQPAIMQKISRSIKPITFERMTTLTSGQKNLPHHFDRNHHEINHHTHQPNQYVRCCFTRQYRRTVVTRAVGGAAR